VLSGSCGAVWPEVPYLPMVRAMTLPTLALVRESAGPLNRLAFSDEVVEDDHALALVLGIDTDGGPGR
jgi:hypothetical protein